MTDKHEHEHAPDALRGRWRVRIGAIDLSDAVLDGSITEAVGEMPKGEFVLSTGAVTGGVDYRAEVVVDLELPSETMRMFTGQVNTAEPREDGVHIDLLGGMPEFQEMGVAALSTRRVDALEMVWAIARTVGLEEENIRIQDFEKGPTESFEVICRIDGADGDVPVCVGSVSFVSVQAVAHLLEDIENDARTEWEDLESGTVAHVLVTAPTVLEAEWQGLEQIDIALAWIALRHIHSFSIHPDRRSRPYKRDWVRAFVSRRDAVIVHGTATGRRWVRSGGDLHFQPDLPLAQIPDIERVLAENASTPQLIEALRAFRRAAEEADPIAAVNALWESVEFYLSETKVRPLFDSKTMRDLRAKATEGLSGERLERVKDVLARVNEAPLLVRLREATAADGVPISNEEFDLLTRVRRFRNDFIHGRTRSSLPASELRYAIALVNRFLTFRVFRLSHGLHEAIPRELVPDAMARLVAEF